MGRSQQWALVGLLGVWTMAGCEGGLWPAGRADSAAPPHMSLVEIGERALETGSTLEDRGLLDGAREAYARAVWALSYHQDLTGEAPLLLDDARGRQERLAPAGGRDAGPTKQVDPLRGIR